jgi:hypothetical protein
MAAWRQIWHGFIGNLVYALFAGVCTVLGFGPSQWVEFLISGMPIFITPGIARLVFLLLGSLTLVSLLWQRIASRNSLVKTIYMFLASLPFVAGSFYVTAVPQMQRQLSLQETQQLATHFGSIKNDVPLMPLAVSSGDEPSTYALGFIDVLDQVGIKYIPLQSFAAPNECGVMVGSRDVLHPSTQAQKVIEALRESGFYPRPISFRPRFEFPYDFDLFIGPACR